MINHLINDMHIYEQVCLNVRDIQELKLLRLPATFHQSKAKLHSIDPCLLDIRLSPSDQFEGMSSSVSNSGHPLPAPIARRSRGESIGSIGSSALALSSSNGSSSSLDLHQSTEAFPSFSRTENSRIKPVTLLAKKVLLKKVERSTRFNPVKKPQADQHQRRMSPIRVTITSQLNPDAAPFFVQQQSTPMPVPNSSIKFYEHHRFRSHQPAAQQPMPANVYRTHQRFIPPRQMARNQAMQNPIQPLIPKNNYRVEQRFHPQQSTSKSPAGRFSLLSRSDTPSCSFQRPSVDLRHRR